MALKRLPVAVLIVADGAGEGSYASMEGGRPKFGNRQKKKKNTTPKQTKTSENTPTHKEMLETNRSRKQS
jgi:hypothetical protein